MFRMLETPQTEATREEWTKYLVNDIECERNAIYQTILDNKFYNGKVNIVKKYHFKSHEQTGNIFKSNTSDESKNISANVSLDTKKFSEKFFPASAEYKLLIEKMIHVVDMFYEAEKDYGKNSQNLRDAIHNCFSFMLENLTDSKVPYNDILHEYSVEMFAFLFGMMALAISKALKIENMSRNLQIPGLAFNTSSVKETWDESWTNNKKSQFLKKYLSVMLEQTDVVYKQWARHFLFKDKSSRDEVRTYFDEFKKFLHSLQDKRAAHDTALLEDKAHPSRFASFFHFGQHHAEIASSTSAPAVNASPKKT